MQPDKLQKLKKLKLFADNPALAMNQEVIQLNDHLSAIETILKSIADKEVPEAPDIQKISLQGAELVTIKGEKGDVGPEPTDERLVKLIEPLIPEPIKGEKGDTGADSKVVGPKGDKGETGLSGKDGINGIDGKNGLNGKDGSPDSPDEIRNKLELLQGKERLSIKAIDGIEDEFKKIDVRFSNIPRGGGGRANQSTRYYDLSSQTNGSLKVFTVPKSVAGVLFSSDFPSVLMQGNGFTINATRTQITMTTDNAPSLGSQLLWSYSSVFNT